MIFFIIENNRNILVYLYIRYLMNSWDVGEILKYVKVTEFENGRDLFERVILGDEKEVNF